MIDSSTLSSARIAAPLATGVLRKSWTLLLLMGLVAGSADAEILEYNVVFAPSPSADAAGYILHVGSESGVYPWEIDLGSPSASGGTISHALAVSHAVDLYVTLSAYDGQGGRSAFSNEVRVNSVPPDSNPPDSGSGSDSTSGNGSSSATDQLLFYESFDDYGSGDEPVDWLDTAAGSSLSESPGLFEVRPAPGGGHALATTSTDSNIHSHYIGANSESWSNYEFFGRMRVADPSAGIGVTVLSDYPNSDSYLRIRRWAEGSSFRLSPHGGASAQSCAGTTATGVVPRADTWYWFRFRTLDEGSATRVLASVWEEGGEMPDDWQIDCLWSVWDSPVGSPGVWSRGPGTKMWDHLGAVPVDDAGDSGGSSGETPTDLYAEDFESFAFAADPPGWVDTDRNYGSTHAETLFEVAAAPGGGRALATRSEEANIHSHYLGSGAVAQGWQDYVYSGRMLATSPSGGVGVTLYSDYPVSDRYIRLRYWPGHSEFRISNRAADDSTCRGTKGTGVGRVPGVWYAFKLRAFQEGSDIRVQAKVWPENENEPAGWQGDCRLGDPATFVGGGAPGLWSTGPGEKYWDDLVVEELTGALD